MSRLTKDYKICFMTLVFSTFLPLSVVESSEVKDVLERWRAHILANGNMAGVELNEDYQLLVELGPVVLPELMSAYEKETDAHVLYYYEILLWATSHFEPVFYTRQSKNTNGYHHQSTEDANRPYLSKAVRDYTPLDVKTKGMRDKYVHWWNQRATFLNRTDTNEKMRGLFGSRKEEYLQLDKQKVRTFDKQRVYGIYNIPNYIELIMQDNNPFLFCELLRITNHPEYQAFDMTNDIISNGFKVEQKYPTRETKAKLIGEWWQAKQKSFSVLKDLHDAIDATIRRLGILPESPLN